jgi:hypothetical protein
MAMRVEMRTAANRGNPNAGGAKARAQADYISVKTYFIVGALLF